MKGGFVLEERGLVEIKVRTNSIFLTWAFLDRLLACDKHNEKLKISIQSAFDVFTRISLQFNVKMCVTELR